LLIFNRTGVLTRTVVGWLWFVGHVVKLFLRIGLLLSIGVGHILLDMDRKPHEKNNFRLKLK